MPGISRKNILRQRFLSPARDFVRLLTTIRSILWTFTSPAFAGSLRLPSVYAFCRDHHLYKRVCQSKGQPGKDRRYQDFRGVSTGIGEHVEELEDKGDAQFEISDGRSVQEVYDSLLGENLQPVMAEYVYV